jgi:predicted N-acetyltransferase YhbS
MDQPFTIREAVQSDNSALLELASSAPIKGRISFRTERRPNFFKLLDSRGPHVLFVAVSAGKIIGSISAAGMNVFVGGEPILCHYIGDFKVHPDFRKTGVGHALAKDLADRLGEMGAERYLSAVIAGNHAPDRFLAGSANWPAAEQSGQFLVRQILPKALALNPTRLVIKDFDKDDAALSLLNAFMKQFRFGTVSPRTDSTRLITASENGKLLAVMSLVDVDALKQDVLTKLPFLLNALLNLLRPFLRRHLPRLNEPVRALYVCAEPSFTLTLKHGCCKKDGGWPSAGDVQA